MEPETNSGSMVGENHPTDGNFNMNFINPMLVNVVVENLGRFLNEKDLLNSRLVHSCWNTSVIPHLKKIGGPIYFSPKVKTAKRTYGMNHMENFIITHAESPNFPFVNIFLSTDIMQTADDVAPWFDFLKRISQTIQKLTVINKRKVATGFAESLEQDFSFPNLQVLVVDQKEHSHFLPYFFKLISIIVAKSPALRKIKFGHEYCLTKKAIYALIENLQIHHVNLQKITELGLTGAFNGDHFISLNELGLGLKSFELNISEHLQELQLIMFLESQSRTLENLSIGYYSFSNLIIMEDTLPIFYKNFLPKLKALTISMELLNRLLSYDEPPFTKVEDLKLPPEVTHMNFPEVVSRFPNLKKLTIPNNPKLIDQVLTIMEDLDELTLFPNYGIIGIRLSQKDMPPISVEYMVPLMEFKNNKEFEVNTSDIREASSMPGSSSIPTVKTKKTLKILTLKGCPCIVKLPSSLSRTSSSKEGHVEHHRIPGCRHVFMQMWSRELT